MVKSTSLLNTLPNMGNNNNNPKKEILAKIQDLISLRGKITRQTSNYVHYVLNTDFIIPEEQNRYSQFKLDIFKMYLLGRYQYSYRITITYYNSRKVIRHIYQPLVLPLERLTNIYKNLYDELINNSSTSSASGQSTKED